MPRCVATQSKEMMENRPHKFPVATISVLTFTAIVTLPQFAYPPVLAALRRSPEILTQHQWWRLITPLFVHNDGWPQIVALFPAILVVGTLAERLFGSQRWLWIYFVCGFVGELAGCAWKPIGAGSSVAVAGLLGALAVWLIFANRQRQALAGGLFILFGAVALTLFRDLHGPPILVGACLGWVMLRSQTSIAQVSRS